VVGRWNRPWRTARLRVTTNQRRPRAGELKRAEYLHMQRIYPEIAWRTVETGAWRAWSRSLPWLALRRLQLEMCRVCYTLCWDSTLSLHFHLGEAEGVLDNKTGHSSPRSVKALCVLLNNVLAGPSATAPQSHVWSTTKKKH
jgi:hypothetical protein